MPKRSSGGHPSANGFPGSGCRISAAPERFVVTVDRKARTVTVRHGTTTVQKSLAPGAVPLVDGNVIRGS